MTSMVQADLGPSSSVVKYKDDPIENPVSLFLFFLSFLVPSQHPNIPVSYPSRRGYGQGVYYYVTFVSLTRARFLYASNMYGPEADLISIIPSCRRDSAFTVHSTLLSPFYHNGKKTLTNGSFDPDILNSTTLVQPFSSIKPTVQAPSSTAYYYPSYYLRLAFVVQRYSPFALRTASPGILVLRVASRLHRG